jgi:hypothetical protein
MLHFPTGPSDEPLLYLRKRIKGVDFGGFYIHQEHLIRPTIQLI